MNLTGIDRDLLLDFVCTLSRFEYALKRASFVIDYRGHAKPDWDRLGNVLGALGRDQVMQALSACPNLLAEPPKQQIVRNGQLAWNEAVDRSISEVEQALRYVRRVRNNLFHGGKYPDPDGPVSDAARNTGLLRESLVVLKAVLDLPGCEAVKTEFYGNC